jgi:broad specificity phosphatase PhoE
LRGWRHQLLATLAALERATVVVTHFFAINAAVGAASGDDRLVSFRPDHCSRTVLENEGGRLRLVQLGAEGATSVH